ncbi:hypothetical protein FRB91_011500 [Serendipita sp. 411]|nr:hypothetical protein FRB91_011500 [Serendipita sp. 411]
MEFIKKEGFMDEKDESRRRNRVRNIAIREASTNAAAGASNVCLQLPFQLPPQTPNNQRATMNSYTFSEGDDDSDFSDDSSYVSANEINTLRAEQEAANP